MIAASLRLSTSSATSSALPHEQVRLRYASLRIEHRCLGDTLTPFVRQTTSGIIVSEQALSNGQDHQHFEVLVCLTEDEFAPSAAKNVSE